MDVEPEDESVLEAAVNPNSVTFEDEDLISAGNLEEAFRLYGYDENDYIDLREKVIITSQISQRLTKAKLRFLSDAKYDKAGIVRDRLRGLQQDFCDIQRKDVLLHQKREASNFEKALNCVVNRSMQCRSRLKCKIDHEAQKRKEELAHSHALEQQRLEEYISNMHRPRVRYSKQLLETLHSEKHLANLDEFEEAAALRRHVSQQLPLEVARHNSSIEHIIQVRRAKLYSRQKFQQAKLEEKLMTKKLSLLRKFDVSVRAQMATLQNLRREMQHRHILELLKPVQFCAVRYGKVRPVVAKRSGYSKTDASFRGTQLLKVVKADAVENVLSVCDLTDFDNLPKGAEPYKP